jgi:hypothetical protein
MFPIFRGQRIDNKEWVEGCLLSLDAFDFPEIIIKKGDRNRYGVFPESLSMSTGQLDKNKVEMFGSFGVDGKMTRGGDKIKTHFGGTGKVIFGNYNICTDDWDVQYITPCFCVEWSDSSGYSCLSGDMEIIGKQLETNP